MATRRRGIAVGRLEGAIYAVGGLDDGACFNIVERYDIEANRWQEVAHTNVQRGGVGVAALGKDCFWYFVLTFRKTHKLRFTCG